MAEDSQGELIVKDKSPGYIGKVGEGLYVVEEWKRILFNGETLKINGDTKDDDRKPPAFTFQNQLGYADVEVDGRKARLLVVSGKVFLASPDSVVQKLGELLAGRKNDQIDSEKLVDAFEKEFEAYLKSLYSKATSLPFEIVSETHWPGETGYAPENPFWRLLFLKSHADEITDAIRFIMARPHSSLIRERRWVRQDQARRFTPNALVAALTRPGNIGQINNQPVFLRFPDAVPRQTFDNPENQFVRFAIGNWVDDLARIKADSGLRGAVENNEWIKKILDNLEGNLTESLYISPLAEAGPFTGIPSTSAVLAKAPGYREIRRLWAEYQRAMALFSDLDRAISLKQIDVIWEYWVLFELMSALHDALGGGKEKWRVGVMGEFQKGHESLIFEFENEKVKLHYNMGKAGYSGISLRPDFLLKIGDHCYVFDAKFRLDWKDMQEIQGKEDAIEESERQKDFLVLAKSADIVKMHAYRDAIKGVKGAFVLYPGEENKLFPASKNGNSAPNGGFSEFLKWLVEMFEKKEPGFEGVGFFGVKRKAEQNNQKGPDQDEQVAGA